MSSIPLPLAALDRPLAVRRRADLRFSEVRFQDERSWVVKDPLSLQYHRLKKPEMIALEMLDGSTSVRQIRDRLQLEYPTQLVRFHDLQQLISSLYQAGLLISDAPGQGAILWERGNKNRRQRWQGRLMNILAIQLPGIDPEPVLKRLAPWCGWWFSRAGILVWVCLVASALCLIVGNWHEFQRRLPEFRDFFAADRLWMFAVVLSVTKVIHELGHGLSCRYFGGECHEIGVMFLVFTPAMYCDTSDSWRLPSKWHRMFIGAAGMYAELAVAAIATIVWWNTTPGMLHYLCLNVMLITSVSSLIFNANPLLRFDGYYILSDFLEVPNLTEKSRWALINLVRRLCLGLPALATAQMPQRHVFWFALYSVASFCYRWFILVMIAWFLMTVFKPYGLQIVGVGLVAFAAAGTLGWPLWRMVKFLAIPGVIDDVKWSRVISSLTAVMVVLAASMIPLPRRLLVPVVIQPDEAFSQRVYVATEGMLERLAVQPGDWVKAGAPLVHLTNREAQAGLARLEGDRLRQVGDLQMLRRRALTDPQALAEIPAADARSQDLDSQIAELRQDLERLTSVANVPGVVLPAHHRAAEPIHDDLQIEEWRGCIFDPQNLGIFLPTGSFLCYVADPSRMKAHLIFNDQDAQLVEVGQSVEIILDAYPTQPIRTNLDQVARGSADAVPAELMDVFGGPIPTTEGRAAERKSMFVVHEATAPIHAPSVTLLPGFHGTAKVTVAPAPLVDRLWKWIRNTLNF